MRILKSKKGLALPYVLGLSVLVIGIVTTLTIYVVSQVRLINVDITETETYYNAVSNVNQALYVIEKNGSLDDQFLQEIETYFNVDINVYNNQVYTITSMINEADEVISYFTGSASVLDVYESIFDYTGTETTFELSPLVTPTNLLVSYLPTYIETQFNWTTFEDELTSFEDVFNAIETLALAGSTFQYKVPNDLESQWQPTAWWYWYVDGPVEILPGDKNSGNEVRNLTVQDDQILFINGDLTMHAGSTIYGNVVVNGDLTIEGKSGSIQGIKGTIYVNGNVDIDKNLTLGTVDRPTFVFAEGDIKLSNTVTGYGYFLSHNFDGNNGGIYITGGVYTDGTSDIPPSGIADNTSFDETQLNAYFIPETITATDGTTGETQTDVIFKATYPKLN